MDFIKGAKSKENYVWSKIGEICNGMVRRFLHKDVSAIDEVVSDTMTKLLENINNYDPERGNSNIEGNFIGWVNKTVEFAIMHYRDRILKSDREKTFVDLAISLGISPDEDDVDLYEKGEEIASFQYLKTHKNQKTPEYAQFIREFYDVITNFGDERIRKAIALYFMYDHTTREIAELLSEKESTVNNWIHRNKKRLKEHLIEKGIDEHYFVR